MKIGILGTGIVGQTLATKLVELGDQVTLGARDASNEKAAAWVASSGDLAAHGNFADAASAGELVINATPGAVAVDALTAAGQDNLAGKTLLDISNPLDFSNGFPPSLSVCNTDSIGEQIQAAFPTTRVIKTLNTMSASVMTNPAAVPGNHNVFVAGNDTGAKSEASEFLQRFGWPANSIVDLGDIKASRGLEAWLLLWLQLMQSQGTADFNIEIRR